MSNSILNPEVINSIAILATDNILDRESDQEKETSTYRTDQGKAISDCKINGYGENR
jgi:hypothetical protein